MLGRQVPAAPQCPGLSRVFWAANPHRSFSATSA